MGNLRGLAMVAAGVCLALAACGGDGTTCTTDDECTPLNTRDGIDPAACPRWVCDMPSLSCVKRLADVDGDGHADRVCPGGDDCNDHDAHVITATAETCNGTDDDCNGVIDDGAFVVAGGQVGAAGAAARYGTGAATGVALLTTGTALSSVALGDSLPTATTPTHAVTNARGTGAGADSVLAYTSSATTPATMDHCITWLRGTEACTTDPDCLQDHGTCDTSGNCSMGAPFTASGSCLVAMAGSPPVPNDALCRQVGACSRGTCTLPATRDDIRVQDCGFDDVAASQLPDRSWLVVGSDRLGCGVGALRVMVGDESLATLSVFGPEVRSNLYTGVDTLPENGTGSIMLGTGMVPNARCTGASRADQRVGARSPSVAALPSAATTPDLQGLVAYLSPGDVHWAPGCATPSEQIVSVMEAFVDLRMGAFIEVNGSNDGVPQEVGRTHATAPVPIVASDGRYLLAFPDSQNGDRIVVETIAPGRGPSPPTTFPSLGDLVVPRPVDAVALPATAIAHIDVGSRPDHVALSRTPPAMDGSYRIGVAWQEGCADTMDAAVKVAVVQVPASGAATVLSTATVSQGMSPSTAPELWYVPDGFVTVGYRRTPSGPAATSQTSGGWVVAFQTGMVSVTSTVFVRVAELDGQPLDAMPVPVRSPPAAGEDVTSSGFYPVPSTSRGRVGFATMDSGNGQLYAGQVICHM